MARLATIDRARKKRVAIYRIRFNIPPTTKTAVIIIPVALSKFTTPSSLRRTTKVAIQRKNIVKTTLPVIGVNSSNV